MTPNLWPISSAVWLPAFTRSLYRFRLQSRETRGRHFRSRCVGVAKACVPAAPDADFVLNAADHLTPGDAASIATALEHFHLLWFDEPCAVSNLNTIRKIAGETVTPLGFGRHVTEPGTFQDLLREGLIDIVRPDLSRNGISQSRRLAAMAEPYYTAVAPHHEGGPIATAAAIHLAASLPNFFIQHVPFPSAPEDRRMRAEIAGAALETVRDGFLALPTAPGLGIQVNEKALENYRDGDA